MYGERTWYMYIGQDYRYVCDEPFAQTTLRYDFSKYANVDFNEQHASLATINNQRKWL